mgnify:CR=1 FL=1
MTLHNMTDLMTDDTHKLVIAHDIHERREYAYTTVGAGKSGVIQRMRSVSLFSPVR